MMSAGACGLLHAVQRHPAETWLAGPILGLVALALVGLVDLGTHLVVQSLPVTMLGLLLGSVLMAILVLPQMYQIHIRTGSLLLLLAFAFLHLQYSTAVWLWGGVPHPGFCLADPGKILPSSPGRAAGGCPQPVRLWLHRGARPHAHLLRDRR